MFYLSWRLFQVLDELQFIHHFSHFHLFCSKGTLIGCTGNFLFIFLEEIGGSKSLMGLAITVSSLTSIPLLLFSNVIFKNLGHPNVLVVGMAFYVIRLIGKLNLNI